MLSFFWSSQPRFYLTLSFLVASVFAIAGLVLFLILIRLRISMETNDARVRARLVEEERAAQELHDTLLQGFQGVLLRIQGAARLVPPGEPARCALEASLDQADEVLIEGRNRARQPQVHDSVCRELVKSFERYISNLQLEKNVPARTVVLDYERPLRKTVQKEILEIGCEALANAFRHSNATAISLELVFGSVRFHMACKDDGVGIGQEISAGAELCGHSGLSNMRKKAETIGATFRILRVIPQGTLVEIVIPARIAYIKRERRSLLKVLQTLMGHPSESGCDQRSTVATNQAKL